MTFDPAQTKSILTSVTFWGAVMTFAFTLFPKISSAFGLTSSNAAVYAQYAGAAVGTLITIWGRLRAKQPVTLTGAPKTS